MHDCEQLDTFSFPANNNNYKSSSKHKGLYAEYNNNNFETTKRY